MYELSGRAAALTLAVPAALHLTTMGLLHTMVNRHRGDRAVVSFTTTALLIVLVALAIPPLALPAASRSSGSSPRGLIAVEPLRPPWQPS